MNVGVGRNCRIFDPQIKKKKNEVDNQVACRLYWCLVTVSGSVHEAFNTHTHTHTKRYLMWVLYFKTILTLTMRQKLISVFTLFFKYKLVRLRTSTIYRTVNKSIAYVSIVQVQCCLTSANKRESGCWTSAVQLSVLLSFKYSLPNTFLDVVGKEFSQFCFSNIHLSQTYNYALTAGSHVSRWHLGW